MGVPPQWEERRATLTIKGCYSDTVACYSATCSAQDLHMPAQASHSTGVLSVVPCPAQRGRVTATARIHSNAALQASGAEGRAARGWHAAILCFSLRTPSPPPPSSPSRPPPSSPSSVPSPPLRMPRPLPCSLILGFEILTQHTTTSSLCHYVTMPTLSPLNSCSMLFRAPHSPPAVSFRPVRGRALAPLTGVFTWPVKIRVPGLPGYPNHPGFALEVSWRTCWERIPQLART